MKKILFCVTMLCSFAGFSQSQHFCKKSVQTSIDSWSYRVYQDDYPMMGFVQIKVETYDYTNSLIYSSGWQSFSNGQLAGGIGYGTYSKIEIRISNEISGITAQFFVENTCP